MAWSVRIEKRAFRELSKLSRTDQQRIIDFLEQRLAVRDNPRELGAALSGPFVGLWKYRIGDYRILCRLDDGTITIWVVKVGHRSEVYR